LQQQLAPPESPSLDSEIGVSEDTNTDKEI
jgi:hypothetical protein